MMVPPLPPPQVEQSCCYGSLPSEVLVAIMEQLSQTDCLTSCTLVCASWAAAVGTASHTVCARLASQEAANQLGAFLQRNGPTIRELRISARTAAAAGAEVQLPLRRLCRLQTLHVADVRVRAAGPARELGGSARGSGRAADSQRPATTSSSRSGGSSSSSTQQRLLPCLARVDADLRALADLASVLQEQQQPLSGMGLRLLTLVVDTLDPPPGLAADVMRHVAALPSVRLALYHSRPRESFASWLEQMQAQHLTSLEVLSFPKDMVSRLTIDAASEGQLARLTNLQHLALQFNAEHGFHAVQALAPLTQLTHLDLAHAPGELIAIEESEETIQQSRCLLLRVLGGLRQLCHLSVDFELLPRAPVTDFSTLTASSALTYLAVLRAALLPRGAGATMFASGVPGGVPGGRLAGWLSALKCLRLTKPNDVPCRGWPSIADNNRIADVVACCPHLEQLWLFGSGSDPRLLLDDDDDDDDAGALRSAFDTDVRRLAALAPTLTELHLHGVGCVDDAASREVFTQLRQLRRLNLQSLPGFSDVGLTALTVLQQLTWLQVRDCAISFEVRRGAHAVFLVDSAQEGPVWQRLRKACMASRVCSAAVIADLEAALANAEARAAAADARADQLAQQLSRAEARRGRSGGKGESDDPADGGAA